MSRGIGEFGPIQEFVPEWTAILVALLTQLGDVWFLGLLVGAVYLARSNNREDGAVCIGLAVAGLSVTAALKHLFVLPRPDVVIVELETLPAVVQPLYAITAAADGYGFPSGHAIASTVVYFSLARHLSISTVRRRTLAGAAVVTLVCLSRVALGVHYLVDVVAGVGVGLLFLAVAEQILARTPVDRATTAFSLAVGCSVSAVLVSRGAFDAVLLLGASLGVFGGWHLYQFGRSLIAGGHYRSRPIKTSAVLGALLPLAVATLTAVVAISSLALGGIVGLSLAAFMTIPLLESTDYLRTIRTALE